MNTGCLDIIDTDNWQTQRIDLRDGLRVLEPLRWKKWASKNQKTLAHFEEWLATFTRPVDIDIVHDRIVILYATGKEFFFDVHSLEGALLAKHRSVNIPNPRINQGRIEGVLDHGGEEQYYIMADLASHPEWLE